MDTTNQPKEVIEKPKQIDAKVSYMDDPEYHHMAEFFDLDYDSRKDPHIANELSYLMDWGKNATGSDDRVTVMVHIRQLAKQLGVMNPFSDSKVSIKKLYQYARLDQDRKRIEKEMTLIGDNTHG